MPLAYSYIRFSTKEQAKGHSLKRQTELREAYLAKRPELTLDTSLTLQDLGVSAFKGANADEGQLGAFIRAIESGIVPKGSFLLIESLDRLSRAKVNIALNLFLSIINQGIVIATLGDDKEYGENCDFHDIIISILVMQRAHEESKRKSDLISKAWENKRVEATKSGRVMSKVVPFWLKAKEDKSGFIVIPEYAAILNRMFDLALDGVGVSSIAKTLNGDGITTPTGKAWKGPNIAKFLRNRAAIGEATFTTFMNEDSKREATDPIPNYFPAVVAEDKFYAIRDKFATTNMSTEHGRKSDNRNLFRRLIRCQYCGNSVSIQAMKYKTKEGQKLYSTLCCSGQVSGNGCKSKRWDYYEFQRLFLNLVREIDVSSLVATDKKQDDIRKVKALIGKERLNHEQLTTKQNNLMSLVEEGVKVDSVAKRIQDLDSQISAASIALSHLERELSILEAETRSFEMTRECMNELIDLLGDPEHSPKPYHIMEQAEIQRRAKLTMMISTLVKEIKMASAGTGINVAPAISDDVILDTTPSFSVTFKSGLTRLVKADGWTMKLDFRKPK
jgi:DNA invertase Pin-like site-specific DNA recombinase